MSSALYDTLRDWHCYARDSYLGGPHYAHPSSAVLGTADLWGWSRTKDDAGRVSVVQSSLGSRRSYLVPHTGETLRAFDARHRLAVHVPLAQPIVDSYADAAVGRVSRSLGALAPYLVNVDGRGGEWQDVVEEVATRAELHGFVATVADSPGSNPARSRADEERLGIGPRCVVVTPAAIAWIDVDEGGAVEELAYVDTPFVPDASAGTTSACVRLYRWTREGFQVLESEVSTGAGIAAQRDRIGKGKELRAGLLPAGMRGEVPVRFAFARRVTDSALPLGVSLVGDVVDLERAIYNSLSNIYDLARKTSFPFLGVPTTGKGLDPEVELQIGPDTALPYTATTGAPAWVESEGRSIEQLRQQIVFDIGMAYRCVGMEVTVDPSATNQSGVALMVRSRDFEARCARFAKGMQRWERSMLDLVARQVGASTADLKVTYPARFVLRDDEESLARATLVYQTIIDKLGTLGTEAVIRQALQAALAVSDDDMAGVMAEVHARLTSPVGAGDKKEIFGYDLELGAITLNQYLEARGFPKRTDGEVPLADWMAEHTARPTPSGGGPTPPAPPTPPAAP